LSHINIQYSVRNLENIDWLTLVLLGTFFLLGITRHLFPDKFKDFIQLPISDRYFKLHGKQPRLITSFRILFFILQGLSFSIFIYLIIKAYDPSLAVKNKWAFIQIITGFYVFVTGKFFLSKIIAQVFKIEFILDTFLFEKRTYANLISVLVLIFNILSIYVYTPTKKGLIGLCIILVLAGFFFFISSIKRNIIAISSRYLYFVLYLCTLEIMPYLILYKVVA